MEHSNNAIEMILSAVTDLRNILKDAHPDKNFDHIDAALSSAHECLAAARVWQHAH